LASTLDLFGKSGDADTVLVAPKRAKNFMWLLKGLRLLEDARGANE
jgi:hypothetical protein